MARTGKATVKPGTLRIIGGQWRGRRLAFTPAEGLRPTTDRVRETLFNWLAPSIHGARCLDLFAGSGALGLEALSRGAASCDFVDTSATALRQIEQHLRLLQAETRARCHPVAASTFLQGARDGYDIIFIDPPFGKALVDPVCARLSAAALVADGALVYVETAARDPLPTVPANCRLHREKVAGEVCYRLYEVAA
ncbi:MAG: 16S rRNA (guanine(966)-N(2))-methyltransferase RsmD [Halieaceae bacterium]|jgi:16S rRNA (guanine966-N2)-methyltransferase|nr:16S rRNA (guanine(966)-N(2))-methyltransferase RsmD [Halieaceae bacterium]